MSEELVGQIDEWFERHPLPLEFADKQLYLDCRAELTKQEERVRELEAAVKELRFTDWGECRGCGEADRDGCKPDCKYVKMLKGTDQ